MQIIINNINEIELYKNELQKIKIWVCNTACGKSYVSSIDDRFYDLDMYRSYFKDRDYKDFEEISIRKMEEELNNGKIILNAAHGHFLNYLDENKIPFVYMYGKPEVEQEHIERMRRRGSSEEFIKKYGTIIASDYSTRNKDERGTIKIELNCNEFASDYIWRVFGKPNKYIKSNNFNKNQYKIAFIDIDGTLLNNQNKLTDFTINTIRKLKKEIKIVLTSARGFYRISPLLKELNILDKDNYTIAYNGSLILNNSENIIYENYIDSKKLYLLKNFFEENYLTDCWFYTYDKRLDITTINDFKDFIIKNKVYKVVCLETPEVIKNIRELISENIKEEFQITSSEESRIEFVEKNMSKEKSIEYLLEQFKLSKKEAIAIGDGENDIGMFKLVDCSIAVSNANYEVKKMAKYVTDSNNDDGVAKALLKIYGE